MKKTIRLLLVSALHLGLVWNCSGQTVHPTIPGTGVRDYSKPGFVMEKDGDKTIAHPTVAGTDFRDYSRPSFILEKKDNTLTAYPTFPGTNIRDTTKSAMQLGAKEDNVGSTSVYAPMVQPTRPNSRILGDNVASDNTSTSILTTKPYRNEYFGQDVSKRATLDAGSPPFTPLRSSNYLTEERQSSVTTSTTTPLGAINANRYDPNSLANPYGAGSHYKSDGLMNPYSTYGSPYSAKSWRNPYATDTPKLYDQNGHYKGKLSTNPFDSDSISNPYGRYGSPYSADSIKNPYGAGNPYSTTPIYVVPSK